MKGPGADCRTSSHRVGNGTASTHPGDPGARSRLRVLGPGRPVLQDQARSKRSRFITLFQAATKSRTNACCESLQA